MAVIQPVAELCVAYGKALKSADGVEGAEKLPFFTTAMEIARKGEAEFRGAELPKGSTWAGLAKIVERRMAAAAAEMTAAQDEPAPVEESVQESAPVESQPQDESVYRVMADGEVFGETSDLQEAKDVAQELGDGATVVDASGAQVFPVVRPEPEPEPELPSSSRPDDDDPPTSASSTSPSGSRRSSRTSSTRSTSRSNACGTPEWSSSRPRRRWRCVRPLVVDALAGAFDASPGATSGVPGCVGAGPGAATGSVRVAAAGSGGRCDG